MKRRAFLKALPIVAVGLNLDGSFARAATAPDPYCMSHTSNMNVLFINIDDLTAHALGCYGHPFCQTAHLDRFATEAMRFSRCYCQVPVPSASRRSFLTGLRPDATSVCQEADRMDPLVPEGTRWLSEILRQYNLHTVNIGNFLHCASATTPECTKSPGPDAAEQAAGPKPGPSTDNQEARLAAHVLAQLAKQKRQFFMSLCFSRSDAALQCPTEYIELYDLDAIPACDARPAADVNIPAVAKRLGRSHDVCRVDSEDPLTDEAARQAIRAYYASASFIDAQIGIVLQALEQTGLNNNTIVIIFSDNGIQLGEHGLWGRGTLFEQSTRVPLLVRVPGALPKGAVCDEIVELVDLLPTICELLVIPPPKGLEGTSFVPLLIEPHQPWKLAAFSVCSVAGHLGRSVRTKRWRYTDWQSGETSLRQFELYDLNADPWEQRNLAQEADYRNQRTILANLLQRGWRVADQRRDSGSPTPAALPLHQAGHILW